MASNGSLRSRRLNTLTRKISYGRMPKGTIVVGMPREYIFIVYRGKEIN